MNWHFAETSKIKAGLAISERMNPISVIIPTYNRANTLERALDSVLKQSFTGWELIICDDGSKDHSLELIANWIKSHDLNGRKVTVLQNESNRGVSYSRNRASTHANGSWLAFLDSDDEWLPDKLSLQMKWLSEHEWNVPLVHGEEIWIRNGVRVNPMKKHAKSGGRIFNRCVDLCCISPSAAVIKRKLLLELGGFREDFPVCEDYDLWLKVCSRFAVGFIETPIVKKFGGHADQLSASLPAMDYFRVKALIPYLESPNLSPDERRHVGQTIQKKCEILLRGYKRHNNVNKYDEVESWSRLWHKSHHAQERTNS